MFRKNVLFILAILFFTLLRNTHANSPTTLARSGSNLDSTVYLPLVYGQYTVDLATDGRASWGTPIAVSPRGDSVWVVNTDAGSVTVLDTATDSKVAEIIVGREPWALTFAPDGASVYVLDRAAGELIAIDTAARRVDRAISVGPEPTAVALTPLGSTAYVTVSGANRVAVIDTETFQRVRAIPVANRPYGVAVSDDGDEDETDEQVIVTHLLAFLEDNGAIARDDGRFGRLTTFATAAPTVREIVLEPNAQGFPNLLYSVTLDGAIAWIPHVRAAPDLPNGLTTTVFAAVSAVDLTSESEATASYLPLNDQTIFGSPVNNPTMAVPSPDGNELYVVLAGSNLVEIIDISSPTEPRLVTFLPTGDNPRGLAVSADGKRGYVMNYLGRSVTVLDLEERQCLAEIRVVAETLVPDVLQGKKLFNLAADPRLSQGSWISCASCHPDGGTDGVTWRFPDGPRQTPALWNAGETLPWHWSAALDEAQDVEETVELIQHGLGLAPGHDPPLLGEPNAGRSTDLDALAAFLQHGIRPPYVRQQNDEIMGREQFVSAGCAGCHGGPQWTSSTLPGEPGTLDPDGNGMVDATLRDVGTLHPLDVRGATGFDPPSLLGVGLTAPYLHDGSMPTLTALLASGHPDPAGDGNGLTNSEIAALVAFLNAIGPETRPVAPTGDSP